MAMKASERWQEVKEILYPALEMGSSERSSFLDEKCGDDAELRLEIESLLAAHHHAGGRFESPAVELMAPVVSDAERDGMVGRSLGHYEIVEKLGAGGMGEVYLAHDGNLHRKVALKILPAFFTQNPDRLRRFQQEARAASALNHPNILTIYEVGHKDAVHYIATEYVDGETLRDRLNRGPLRTAEAIEVATQIANALGAAHDAGIIHRDIKPENVMLRRDGIVKVVDFGIAKLSSRPAGEPEASTIVNTAEGVVIGTAQYMSPEQARGLPVTGRTDIFSLGTVLYEMVAGRAPFAGGTTADMLVAILEKEPPPLKNSASNEVPAELESITTKTLRKDPDERYQTSKELFVDLQRLRQKLELESHLERSAPPESGGKAITADFAARATVGRTDQLRHFLSARRTFPYAAALAILVLGGLAYTWSWRQDSLPPQSEIRSLAVLPLRSLGDTADNHIGLGIADAVIRRISQTGELTVRPTSAVRRYLTEETDALTAARQLKADVVLEGSVQNVGDRLRVSVNLLRTSDESSLWADSFDMRMSDIFTIQDTVAQQVAARLRLRLNPEQQARMTKRHTLNPEAYEYFLKGQASLDQRTIAIGNLQPIETAIGYFKKAVELDPKYALAYVSLADSYSMKANFNDPDNPVWIELMKEALATAESIDPQLAEIHSLRSDYFLSQHGGWDFVQAEREARQALVLNPSVGHAAMGQIHDHLGLDETTGLREFQRDLEIDPTDEFRHWRLADAYFLYGKFDEALEVSRRSSGVPFAPALIGKGLLDEASQVLEMSLQKSPGNMRDRSSLALIMALRGQHEEAEAAIPAILQQARNQKAYHHITYNAASIYALGGNAGESVKWLRTTAETGMPNYPLFERDPYLNRIRQAPEFIQFMSEMRAKFEEYKREFG